MNPSVTRSHQFGLQRHLLASASGLSDSHSQVCSSHAATLARTCLLSRPSAVRSPLLLSPRRPSRQSRLIPVRSSAVSHAQHSIQQSRDGNVRPLISLLVPAVAGLLLSRFIDGKAIMLGAYWAVRYFAPAIVSLWVAKQFRKHWDPVSAVVVMAASYAASMAVSYRLLAGPTSTVRLHYPLFNGNVTIPMVVAKWIRHNGNLAKLLTKALAYGPWLLLSLAAALQLAVWLDAKGRNSQGAYALQSNATRVHTSAGASPDSTPQAKPAATPGASPLVNSPSKSDKLSEMHTAAEQVTSQKLTHNGTAADETEVEIHLEGLDKPMFVQGLYELLLDLNKYLLGLHTAPVQLPVYLQSRAERLEATAQEHVSRHISQGHSDWNLFQIICKEIQATLAGGQKLRRPDVPQHNTDGDAWLARASHHHATVADYLRLAYIEPLANGEVLPQAQLLSSMSDASKASNARWLSLEAGQVELTTAQAEDAEGKVLGAEREEAGEEEASSDTEAWDDSVDEGDSDADLWNSSEEEEDSDADLWGSSEDEEDSDDVFKIVAEADEVCSGEDDETSCEEAEEEERSLNAETDKKVGQQLLDAQKQVEQLQDELSRQTKSGQTSQEALAIEHKCTRDKLQAEVDRLQAELASAYKASADSATGDLLHQATLAQLDSAKQAQSQAEGHFLRSKEHITAQDKLLTLTQARLEENKTLLEGAVDELAVTKEEVQEAKQARMSAKAASKRNDEQQQQLLQQLESQLAEAADKLSLREACHVRQLAEKERGMAELTAQLEEVTAKLHARSQELLGENGAVASLTSQLKDAQAKQGNSTAQLLHSILTALKIPVSEEVTSASMFKNLESAWQKANEEHQLLSSRLEQAEHAHEETLRVYMQLSREHKAVCAQQDDLYAQLAQVLAEQPDAEHDTFSQVEGAQQPADHTAATSAAAAAAAAGQAAAKEAASAAEAKALEASLAANAAAAEATAVAKAAALDAIGAAESDKADIVKAAAAAAADAKNAAARRSANGLMAPAPSEGEVKITEVTGGLADGEVNVTVHSSAATAQQPRSAASFSAQISKGKSDGSTDIDDSKDGAASGKPVQPSNKVAASLVQVTDGGSAVQDGEVMVNVAPATTEDQDPAKKASIAIEINEGKTDTLDGDIKVTVAESSKVKEASDLNVQRGTTGRDTDGSGANGSNTKPSVAPSKAGGESGRSFVIVTDGDAGDAGSEVEVSTAGGSTEGFGGNGSFVKDNINGNMAAQDGADDGTIEITVDKSLLD